MRETTAVDRFLSQSEENRLAFEQEKVIVGVTELLSELMEQKHMTKSALAKRLGTSKAYVTQALRGDKNLSLRTVASFFYALEQRVELRPIALNEMSVDTQWGEDFWNLSGTAEAVPPPGQLHYRPTDNPKILELLRNAA
ncbi:MAG: helix-turn-helix transcriptional regulator [Acidobacteriaceae bacterium]